MLSTSHQAEIALLDVSEGYCPLCHVGLIRHDDRACCPCGGCSYRAQGLSLLMGSCTEHPAKDCEHWQLVGRLSV